MFGDFFDDWHEDEPFEFFAEVAVNYDVLVRVLVLCDTFGRAFCDSYLDLLD